MSRAKLATRLSVLCLTASAVAVLTQPTAIAGGTAYRPITALSMGYSDYLKNYDFEGEVDAQNNVDWAVSILAYNGASVDRFKSLLNNQGFGANSTDGKHGRASDGAGYRWDRDAGKKGVTCPAFSTTPHYRVYADGDQYLYNQTYGTYVYASTHRDRDECGGGNKSFYGSEGVEGLIVNKFSYIGQPVYHDYASFYNYEPYRAQGTHIWDNDGNASYVNLRY